MSGDGWHPVGRSAIRTAIGSLAEADTQLGLALRLRFVQRNACETLLGTIEDARRFLEDGWPPTAGL